MQPNPFAQPPAGPGAPAPAAPAPSPAPGYPAAAPAPAAPAPAQAPAAPAPAPAGYPAPAPAPQAAPAMAPHPVSVPGHGQFPGQARGAVPPNAASLLGHVNPGAQLAKPRINDLPGTYIVRLDGFAPKTTRTGKNAFILSYSVCAVLQPDQTYGSHPAGQTGVDVYIDCHNDMFSGKINNILVQGLGYDISQVSPELIQGVLGTPEGLEQCFKGRFAEYRVASTPGRDKHGNPELSSDGRPKVYHNGQFVRPVAKEELLQHMDDALRQRMGITAPGAPN